MDRVLRAVEAHLAERKKDLIDLLTGGHARTHEDYISFVQQLRLIESIQELIKQEKSKEHDDDED